MRTQSLIMIEDIKWQNRGDANIRRINQLRNSQVNRDAGDDIGKLPVVAIGINDIVNDSGHSIACSQIDVIRQIRKEGGHMRLKILHVGWNLALVLDGDPSDGIKSDAKECLAVWKDRHSSGPETNRDRP